MTTTVVLERPRGRVENSSVRTAAWLAVTSLAVSLLIGATSAPVAAPPVVAQGAVAEALGVSGLPLPAQALMSQTLGKGDHAYHVRDLAAINPRQQLTATFTATGVTVRAGGDWLGLRLAGPPVDPVVAANRVEYRHASVTEWYANGPLGLEQGFTLARPSASPLRVEVSGPLEPQLVGRTVLFGDVFRLRGLFAQDAVGGKVSTRFELRGRTLLMHVDDAGARYPITVDPFIERAKLTASDPEAHDQFAYALAAAGDTVVVGSWGDDTGGTNAGAAYVFVRAGSLWSQQAKLTAADAAAGDELGLAVAVAGDTAVVGALGDDSFKGSAYVFVRSGTAWSQQAKLTALDGAASDLFGDSLALAGETLLVGARGDDSSAGAAYVFLRAGSVWIQQAKLTASDRATNDLFGMSVGVVGDTAVVGAMNDDTGAARTGSAYVFVRSGAVWSQQAKLTASDAALDDLFGVSVALTGETAVIGAYGDDTTAGADAGSAYVFVRSGTVWSQQAKLTASDGAPSDLFGFGVAATGDTAVVGAWLDDTTAAVDAGSAYVFVRSGSVWSEDRKLTASDAAGSDQFGISVALTDGGSTVAVGARADDLAAGENAGSAYVFETVACGFSGATLFIEVPSGGSVSVVRSGADIVVSGAGACAGSPTVSNTDTISLAGAAGAESVTIDLTGGAFAPGATDEGDGSSEIEWALDLGGGGDTVTVTGTDAADTIRLGSAGVNLSGDGDADITVTGTLALVTVSGGLGNDRFTGQGAFGADPDPWASPLALYGQDGMDKLTGGTGNDLLDGGNGKDDIRQLNVSDGADTIVGGAAVDQVSYSTRGSADPLSVTLDGLANDGSIDEGDNVGIDVENVLLGAGADFFDGTATPLRNLVRGGAGIDELHGGGAADQVRGDGGNDLLFGEGGNDVVNGVEPETGTSDTLSGGAATDTCYADDNDTISDC